MFVLQTFLLFPAADVVAIGAAVDDIVAYLPSPAATAVVPRECNNQSRNMNFKQRVSTTCYHTVVWVITYVDDAGGGRW